MKTIIFLAAMTLTNFAWAADPVVPHDMSMKQKK